MIALEKHELMAQVASMYYEQDLTQNEIADQLGLSRVKIYRLLREARQANVVQIKIDWPLQRDEALEAHLKDVFNLQDARVLKTPRYETVPVLNQIGNLTARYLEQRLSESSTMAICLGRSTYEVINAIRPDFQANVQVVQAVGTMSHPNVEYDSSMLARQLAQKLGGQAMYLTSPLMADTVHDATVIRHQRNIQFTLNAARSADIALIGIGNLDTQTSGFVREGFLSIDQLEKFIADGAVGDIAWQIFTKEGQVYPCEFNDRVIGINLDELRQIPMTIAIAAGTPKAQAIVGALKTEVINVICTDDKTAELILRLI
jgi:deoxyribonucleoside regulator